MCLKYLKQFQQENGSWIPLWFGSQKRKDGKNPVYGTAMVIAALNDYIKQHKKVSNDILEMHSRGCAFLRSSQPNKLSIEELALSITALAGVKNSVQDSFLKAAVKILNAERKFQPTPIGLYFASLWYSEKLYPLIWAVEAESSLSETNPIGFTEKVGNAPDARQ
jgi:squalene-hopene/tetraprenyl-beta-curcumene cyclase